MLAIDILRNYFPRDLSVLMGDFLWFGCPKDTQTPCWLRPNLTWVKTCLVPLNNDLLEMIVTRASFETIVTVWLKV